MLDKRAFVRDQRIANNGLLRRIRLRIRPTPSAPAYNPDPTIDTQQNYNPDNDTLKYVTGVFEYLKESQSQGDTGVYQSNRGLIFFHPNYKTLVDQAYKMYIGGTNKEWEKSSPAVWDESRCMLRMLVETAN